MSFGRFRASSSSAIDASSTKVTKRPRESLICAQCRFRKIRCDRGQPCTNCVRRGETACCYEKPSNPPVETKRATAEDRLLHLEHAVRQLMQAQTQNHTPQALAPQIQTPATDLELRPPVQGPSYLPLERQSPPSQHQHRNKEGNNETYVGSTHWSAILDDISGLREILRPGNIQEPGEAVSLEPSYSDHELIFGDLSCYDVQYILTQILPPKFEVDRLLSLYFRGETFVVPFVHSYCFQRQYNQFWSDKANVNPLWLSMLLSICCLASMVGEYQSSRDDLATRRSAFHAAAGQCLVLGEYHRSKKFAVEALAMYAHCKNLRTLDPSREAGMILGIVVRLVYEMGYHRDADSCGNFSAFEGEMRRRLWAVVKQMDLMISFQLGLPSNINLDLCDTKSPRNLLDSDFDEDTQVLPASRSETQHTNILWFIVKDRQMVSFGKVCQAGISFEEKSEGEILQLDTDIRRMFEMTPAVLRTRPLSESITDPGYLVMTRLYVEFIYLKSLCALHRKPMARGNAFSTQVCIQAGTTLVKQFIQMYDEFSPGGQLYMERWMLKNFTMNDFLMGIMVLCLILHIHWEGGCQNQMVDDMVVSEASHLLQRSYDICVEKSKLSRDALRVSHAIRITLTSAKHLNTKSSTMLSPSPGVYATPASGEGSDPASILLHARHYHSYGNEATFGALDPFNFIGYDLEGIDWSMFD